MSCMRSSFISVSSTTTSLRPQAASAASMDSEPNRANRSRCSTTMVLHGGVRQQAHDLRPVFRQASKLTLQIALLGCARYARIDRNRFDGWRFGRMDDDRSRWELFCRNRQLAGTPPRGLIRQPVRLCPC